MHINLLYIVALRLSCHQLAHCLNISGSPQYPTRTIANVTVIDTPIVRAAQSLAQQHASSAVYTHIIRSWLFGALLIQNNATYANADVEVHAVATLLHDLGWDMSTNNTFVSLDKRFEVDGAIASRSFIHSQPDGKNWTERRIQLVWDSIALHTERDFSYFKEPEVQITSMGIGMDFAGPSGGVPQAKYDYVVQQMPKEGFKGATNETLIWLCGIKPLVAMDTWMQPWGEYYVSGYNSTIQGKRKFDTILSKLP